MNNKNTFEDFGLREELVKGVAALGFTTPSPIQQKAIPILIQKPTDIIALAQTGTGKTAAFGLPILERLDLSVPDIQALVLSPTRELCMQIQEELQKYATFLKGGDSIAVYGGTPIGGQIRELKKNKIQIVVATPGRLIDLLERNAIRLDAVNMLVLDEADEMLNMGFRDDIDFILKNTPVRQSTWLFSATMNNDVRRISKRYMTSPVEVSVAKENAGNENIDHQYFVTNAHQRFDALRRLLDFVPDIYGIIFTRTKQDAHDIAERLMREGYSVSALHGDMDQKMRTKVMDRFKHKSLQAIVATDVAARGIDVQDITHVINFELPVDPEIYTHRSGRTGRAGKSGVCMSLVTNREIGRIRQVERIAKTRFHKRDIPDGAEIIRKRLFHFLDQIESAAPENTFGDIYKKSIHERFEKMDKDELIHRLLWLQLKDTIADYARAPDLNAGFDNKKYAGRHEGGQRKNMMRVFINIGRKDGAHPGSLIQFVAEMTDLDPQLISGLTVTELSSFFNIPVEAFEYAKMALAQQKFNGRKVRVEEATQRADSRRSSERGRHDNYRKGAPSGRKDFGRENPRFTKARKQPNKF